MPRSRIMKLAVAATAMGPDERAPRRRASMGVRPVRCIGTVTAGRPNMILIDFYPYFRAASSTLARRIRQPVTFGNSVTVSERR